MLKRFLNTVFLLTLILLACGCSVLSVSRIRQKVASLEEELFSQSTVTLRVLVTATSTPTRTATPTVTPTPTKTPPPTATYPIREYSSPTFEVLNTAELPFAAQDNISNVSDITIPDGTILDPGEIFIKSWRMTNSGSRTWTEDTKLMMAANFDLDTPPVVKAIFVKPNDWIDFTPGGWGTRIYNVGPGTEADLAVILKAPTEPGSYQIDFRLVNPSGEVILTQFWMQFSVSRPTETPVPTPTSETPQPESDALPYEWSGRWMLREPFHADGIIPVNAWLEQNDEEMRGFFYDSNGNPILIKGALSDSGRSFAGEFFYPWDKQTNICSWRMQISRNQFYAITRGGVMDENTICGARDGKSFPDSCALPNEG